MITATEKACSTCQAVKPLAEFYRYRRNKDGRRHSCRACTRRYVALYNKGRRREPREKRDPLAAALMKVKDGPHWRHANIADYVIAVLDARTRREREQAEVAIPRHLQAAAQKWLAFFRRNRRAN